VLLMTAPANMADWPPVHHDIAWSHADPDYDAHIAELEALLVAGDLDSAERAGGAWRREFGEDAMFTFLEGQIARQRGDPASARRLFRRAADLDPYPWRALSEQNAFIRELAQREGAVLVDVELAFAQAAPDGLVGFGLVGDNVHPTPLGASLMALEVARGLRRAGLPLGEPDPDYAARAERFLMPRFDLKLAYLWRLLHGRYCMKTPFYYYGAARNYLESARQLAPLQWMAQANLGALSLLEGDPESGLRLLREAARLRGEPLDPKKDRVEIPMLGVALEQAGLGAEALAPP
jgi:tetratricopeptide (TPR) repeat protein